MFESTISLTDGRRLGYAEYGPKHGYPVFLFHGVPGSRFQPIAFLSTRDTSQLRIVVPERPGYGLSDAKPDRTLLDHAADVRVLADHLGIQKFSVIGISGGGPYALACDYALPERVERIAIVAGVAPLDVPQMIDKCGPLERVLFAQLEEGKAYVHQMSAALHHDPDGFIAHAAKELPEADRARITKNVLPMYRDMLLEALRTEDGMLDDYAVLAKPWGFPIGNLQAEVHLWHSTADEMVFFDHAEYLSTHLPSATLHALSGAGHLGTALSCYQQVIQFLQTGFVENSLSEVEGSQ